MSRRVSFVGRLSSIRGFTNGWPSPLAVTSGVGVIITNVDRYIDNTTNALRCETGSCHTLFLLYSRFASAVCGDVVPGFDLYWTSLLAVLCLSIILMAVLLFLAKRLVNFRLDKSNKFHLTSSVLRQVRGTFWFLVGAAVNMWLIVAIAHDEYFHEVACKGGGCCPECVWAFGIVFLFFSILIGGVSRVYQCAILHRLSSESWWVG